MKTDDPRQTSGPSRPASTRGQRARLLLHELGTAEKFLLLTALYMAQGLPFGFFVQALPVLLRAEGLSLPAIGLTSLLSFPWALKFLWAPWVDRQGWRRRIILAMQGASAALMLTISLIDPSSQMWLLLGAVLLTNWLAATQDIATDALAIELLDFEERGPGNGIQVAAYRIGMILGGGLLLVLFGWLGWVATFVLLAAMIALTMVPLWLCGEQAGVMGRLEGVGEERVGRHRALVSFVTRPGVWAWLVVLVCYKLGESLAGGMLRPYLVDEGLDVGQIGWLLGGAGFTTGLLGAMAGGVGSRWMKTRWRALIGFGALQALGNGCYWLVSLLGVSWLTLAPAVCLEHFTGGMATAILFTMMMDASREESAGTDYTIMASVVVLTVGLGQALSGYIVHATSYTTLFATSTIACLLGLLIIQLLKPLLSPVLSSPVPPATRDISSVFE